MMVSLDAADNHAERRLSTKQEKTTSMHQFHHFSAVIVDKNTSETRKQQPEHKKSLTCCGSMAFFDCEMVVDLLRAKGFESSESRAPEFFYCEYSNIHVHIVWTSVSRKIVQSGARRPSRKRMSTRSFCTELYAIPRRT